MKILVISNFYYPFEVGGAEESLRLQCEALAKSGNEVSLITVNHSGLEEDCSRNGVYINYVKTFFRKGSPRNSNRDLLSRLGWQFGGIFQVPYWLVFFRCVLSNRPDIVYFNNLPGMGRFVVFICKLIGLKIVACLRDYAWVCLRQSKFKSDKTCNGLCLECKIGTLGRRAVSYAFDGVSANSSELLKTIKNDGAFPMSASRVIYAGCEIGEYNPIFFDCVNDSPLVIGVMGQVIPSKGFREFLSEVKSICDSGKARVIVAGDIGGDYAKNLISDFKFEWVEFKGRMKRSDFFDSVDIIVIPSVWNEPLSRITYEAMASGKCLIASSFGGQKEIVVHGENGFLYTPGDGSLSEILNLIIEDKSIINDISMAGYESAKKYSPSGAAENLIDLFEGILGDK